jgi:hypothetical protein
MTKPPAPDFILVGPQKCATTWLYECLYEHPEVLLPETDSVHYFDMNYNKKEAWYQKFFSEYDGETIVGEETPSYIRDQRAPKRIAEVLPDVKLIFTLRNPIDRAYSHWWHERSKNKHVFDFDDVFHNYDLYNDWVVPGLYYHHLSRYQEYFPTEQIKVCFFDDLVDDDLAYYQDVCSFLNIDTDYVPDYIGDKANEGRYRFDKGSIFWTLTNGFKQLAPGPIIEALRPIHNRIVDMMASQTEYEEGMDTNVRRRLEPHFVDDVSRLSDYTGRDLDHWFEFETIS